MLIMLNLHILSIYPALMLILHLSSLYQSSWQRERILREFGGDLSLCIEFSANRIFGIGSSSELFIDFEEAVPYPGIHNPQYQAQQSRSDYYAAKAWLQSLRQTLRADSM